MREFRKGDIIVEIGTQNFFMVSEANPNHSYYSLRRVDRDFNDLQEFYGADMEKVHENYVRVGRLGQRKFVEGMVRFPTLYFDDEETWVTIPESGSLARIMCLARTQVFTTSATLRLESRLPSRRLSVRVSTSREGE